MGARQGKPGLAICDPDPAGTVAPPFPFYGQAKPAAAAGFAEIPFLGKIKFDNDSQCLYNEINKFTPLCAKVGYACRAPGNPGLATEG